jgi:hypothetical protein
MEEEMNKMYEPDNRFVDRLEWQLSSEYRRVNRSKPAVGKIAVPRRVAAMAIMVGILMTGVAVTKAADYIKDSWRKKIETARVETEVELKKVHLESIRDMASDVKLRVSNGLVREDEYQAMTLAVNNAELDLKRSLLNLDEVKMSGDIPRNELCAPLVGSRDFVSERLIIEKEEIELTLEQIRIHLERVKELAEAKAVRGDEVAHLKAELANRKVMTDKIQERLDLRRRFLEGTITAREVEIEDRITGAERNMRLAQSRVDALKEQMAQMKALEVQGSLEPTETRQMEYALAAAEAQLKLAALEMDVLLKLK